MNRPERKRARAVLLGMALATIGISLLLTTGPALAQVEPYSEESPSVLPTRIVAPNQGDNAPDDELPVGKQPNADQPDDSVKPNRITQPDEVQPNIQPNVGGIVEPEAGALPFTGAQVTTFALAGLLIVGSGLLILRKSRD